MCTGSNALQTAIEVKQKRLKERPIRTITVIICSLLLYSKAIALEDLPIKGKLIYQNNLSTEADVANWIMEGPGVIEFKDGWMELFSPNAEFHHVFWCREDFPDNFVAEWDVQNLNTASGLCIVFFAAHGTHGQDIFEEKLPKRNGDFKWYIKDQLNSYHISYYTNTPKKPNRGKANLRKNNQFRLVQEGKEGIPADSTEVHHVSLIKEGPRIRMLIDGHKIIDWTDTDETDPRASYTSGKFGLRQMQWTHFRYRNLRVHEVLSPESFKMTMADLPLIHPKQREWASPSRGNVVAKNPPALLWETTPGKNVRYEVRLSRDASFRSEDTYNYPDIPWALLNPDRHLGPESWYWQVRRQGGDWSATHHFVVDTSSMEWSPPSTDVLFDAVPDYRPRVLVDAPDLQNFREQASKRPERKRIIQAADSVFERKIPSEKEDILKIVGATPKKTEKLRKDASKEIGQTLYAGVSPLCRAYLLTGEKRYAEEAIRWAMEASTWDPDGVTHINDFGDSRIMLSMAMVYDSLQEYLSDDETRLLGEATAARARNFYERYVNEKEALVLSNHLWQHILHYFFDTAIALKGDYPEADKWLSYLYNLFLARTPVIGGKDGGWVHGLSYFRMNFETLIDIPLRIKAYTGYNFFEQTPWYVENVNYFLYGFPPGSAGTGFADNSHDLPEPRGDYLAYADALSRITGNAHAAWYSNEIARVSTDLTPHYQDYWRNDYSEDGEIATNLGDTTMLRWVRLRYLYKMEAPEPEAPTDLPMARAFKGIGLVTLHAQPLDQPADSNLFFAMRSSPYGAHSHMLADQNTFNMIYGGDRLFYHTGNKVAMGAPHRLLYYKHTKSHNGILINGEGQPYTTEAYGWIEDFINGEKLAYVVGNASNAYRSAEENIDTGLQTFRRHVLMLRPNIIVIYDELEAEQPSEWTYALHSYHEMRMDVDAAVLHAQNEKGYARVHIYGSSPLEWDVSHEYPVPASNWRGITDAEGNLKEYTNNAWHFSATSESVPKMRYLSIFEVQPNAFSQPFSFSETITGEDGALSFGDWTIRAELNPDALPRIQISNTINDIYFDSNGKSIMTTDGPSHKLRTEGAQLIERKSGFWIVHESSIEAPPGAIEAAKHLLDKNTDPQCEK